MLNYCFYLEKVMIILFVPNKFFKCIIFYIYKLIVWNLVMSLQYIFCISSKVYWVNYLWMDKKIYFFLLSKRVELNLVADFLMLFSEVIAKLNIFKECFTLYFYDLRIVLVVRKWSWHICSKRVFFCTELKYIYIQA